jgi:hypothetical protein
MHGRERCIVRRTYNSPQLSRLTQSLLSPVVQLVLTTKDKHTALNGRCVCYVSVLGKVDHFPDFRIWAAGKRYFRDLGICERDDFPASRMGVYSLYV